MRRGIMCAPLALLFLAAVVPSQAQKDGGGRGGGGAGGVTEVVVPVGAALTLECPLRVEAAAAWRREGGALPADLAVGERAGADGRLVARLTSPRAALHHAGVYSCGPAPDQRLRLAVLDPASAPAASETSMPASGDSYPAYLYDVGHEIALTCDLSNPGALPVVWKKNGTAVDQLWDVKERYRVTETDGGNKFVLPPRTQEDDFGNYTCSVGEQQQGWRVQGRPHSKMPANTNVVEGQKLKLQCRVFGKPWPAITWLYVNSTEEEELGNGTDALVALGGRANVTRSDQGVEGGALVVEAAARGDAGRYICRVSDDRLYNGATVLRVKDMYAALWPFLGICAEVLVLCAVILVYEKRRTKPELDDSDTDNHDQKKS